MVKKKKKKKKKTVVFGGIGFVYSMSFPVTSNYLFILRLEATQIPECRANTSRTCCNASHPARTLLERSRDHNSRTSAVIKVLR